jgi:septum formation protein
MRLVLASASPRRRLLLRQIGLEPEVVPAAVSEIIFTKGGADEAIETARRKGTAVAAQISGPAIVLAADTVVVLDGDILGKPGDETASLAMLRRLNGRPHQVITGVYVVDTATGKELERAACTGVWFKTLRESQLARYAASGEGADKAGAYAIQGRGALLVERLAGSYSNVVGLPLELTADMLSFLGCELL